MKTVYNYNLFDMFDIKDNVNRNVYLWKNFDAGSVEDIDGRIVDYINRHINQTLKEDLDDYLSTLVCMLMILNRNLKNELKNYNLLFDTILINYYKGKRKEAWETIKIFKKDDYEIWIRRKKIVTLKNKIRNDKKTMDMANEKDYAKDAQGRHTTDT